MLSKKEIENINDQIKEIEGRIDELLEQSKKLKIELFQDEYPFNKGDIITDGKRKVRFIEHDWYEYHPTFNTIVIKQDGTDGIRKKYIIHSFSKWRQFGDNL